MPVVTNDLIYDVTIKEYIYDKVTINQIVDIHMNTFTGFFLTFLGKDFLKQLYKGFSFHIKSGLFIAEHNNVIVGFLAYSEDISDFYKYLIKKSVIPFAWFGLGATIRKPSSMIRLIMAFLKPGESKREEAYIELSSIGVLPQMKGQNIGSKLIKELKDKYRESQFAYIKLETDAENNESVNSFYKKNGFMIDHEYKTSEGRKMYEYRWSK